MAHVIFALIWKNILLRLNFLVSTLCEIFIPLILLVILNSNSEIALRPSHEPITIELNPNSTNEMRRNDDSILYSPSNQLTTPFIKQFSEAAGLKWSSKFNTLLV